METFTRESAIENEDLQRHAHHWLIEEASGAQSSGRCKTCGATKAFKNWLSDSDFITNEEHRQAA